MNKRRLHGKQDMAGQGSAKRTHRIMLSGFDTQTSKIRAIELIQKLRGTYVHDTKNSQAFVPSCTHIVCKNLSRTEKYICACASGKWILTAQYLEDSFEKGHWVSEDEYEWGLDLAPKHQEYLIATAPRRWRQRLKVNGGHPPFLGWIVGLVMSEALTDAYIRILAAGGGVAFDISSWHCGSLADGGAERNDEIAARLTHVLVLPRLADRIVRSTMEEGVPYVRSEFLAMQLIKDPPPSVEEYLLFPDSEDKHLRRTPATVPKMLNISATSRLRSHQGSDGSAGFLPAVSSLTGVQPFQPPRPENNDQSKEKMACQTLQTSSGPCSQESLPKPLPASIFANGSFVSTPSSAVPNSDSASSPSPQTTMANAVKSVLGAIEGARSIKLPDAWSFPIAVRVPSTTKHHVPTILLGAPKRTGEAAAGDAPAVKSSKKYFSDEFFERNEAVIREYAMRKQREQSSYGILQKLVNLEHTTQISDSARKEKAVPFSQEMLTYLEASLELPLRNSYFLKEVSSLLTRIVYPRPEVLYIIMRVILLDAEDTALALSAQAVLNRILTLHPPQAQDIKVEKLYHKALSLMTAADAEEMSSLMTTVDYIMNRTNTDEWRFWCSKDQSLGAHWAFVSRVLRIAINPAASTTEDGQRVVNASLLVEFLADLIVRDYHDVTTMRAYPAYCPMIKCLIADLLWPNMTGLEPWYRRQSANLADMVSHYVRAAEVCASFKGASKPVDDSDNDRLEDIDDLEETSLSVLQNVGRLMAVTASWCVHCDMRDRDRQTKRTSSRTLESELVNNLRSGLEHKSVDVNDLALSRLPVRLRLKAIVALLQQTCSDALTRDTRTARRDGELSLETITAHLMQMFPAVHQGEERKFAADPAEESGSSHEAREGEGQEERKTQTGMATRVNKRNRKGETALHVACMNNKPKDLKSLLDQPGIDPNATDYAGWTPLGEACNHGHVECVKVLLNLPLGRLTEGTKRRRVKSLTDSAKPPPWAIDLTLCPAEGLTPLHDALANDNQEIARLLLRKGGSKLLDKLDAEGKGPLDYCSTEAARDAIIEYACKISVVRGRKRKLRASELMALAPMNEYEKVLPSKSVLTGHNWRERVVWLCAVTRHLLFNYVTSGHLLEACTSIEIESESSDDATDRVLPFGASVPQQTGGSDAPFHPCSKSELERYANDLVYCLRWKECWESYREHLSRVLGGDEDYMAAGMVDTQSPIPLDLMANFDSTDDEEQHPLR